MSDPTHDSIDALLSADLDGETTRAEHDRIAADPALRTRQAELRSASRLAGQMPDPLSSAVVDDAISRALNQPPADEIDRPTGRNGSSGRTRVRAAPVPWLVAAAVVLLAAIGLGLIVTARSPSQRADTTSGAARRPENKSAPPSSPQSTVGTADAAPLGFIGNFASPAALRAELSAKVPASRQGTAGSRAPQLSAAQANRCATVIEARNPQLLRTNRQAVVTATIAGEPVVVLEYRAKSVKAGARQTTRVIALGAAACDERIDFER